jgi:undecaprenyl pyrophosphate phosphatase UppP
MEYSSLKRRRVMVGLVGCLAGLIAGVPVTYLLYGVLFNATTFAFCCAGIAVALLFGEKAGKIVKREELSWIKMQESTKSLRLRDSRNEPSDKSKSHR